MLRAYQCFCNFQFVCLFVLKGRAAVQSDLGFSLVQFCCFSFLAREFLIRQKDIVFSVGKLNCIQESEIILQINL